MTVIGSSNPIGHDVSDAAFHPTSWWHRVDAWIDAFLNATIDTLTRWLCRASRGYLCPPDMTSVMYPEESRAMDARRRECCDEKLPGK
jgi:hypothetical protein